MPRRKSPGEICYRSRRLSFTERDELAFSRVLREFSPQTVMFEIQIRYPLEQAFNDRIPNIPSARPHHVGIYMPSPGQESTWELPDDRGEAAEQSICCFVFERGGWSVPALPPPGRRWIYDWPSFRRTRFEASYPCTDVEMKKFAMKVLRLTRRITDKYGRGLDAIGWVNAKGKLRNSVRGEYPIEPDSPVLSSKYYDDSLWDDRLPDVPTIPGAQALEWFFESRKEVYGTEFPGQDVPGLDFPDQ